MKYLNNLSLLAILATAFVLGGCDKTKPYDVVVPPPQAHFVGKEVQTYKAEVNPAPIYNVVVGTTDVAKSDRLVTYNVTSLSGAVGGNQFTIASGNSTGTVTIKAGEAIANIAVQANAASYVSGRKDTLMFTLAEPSIKPAGFLDTVYLILRGPCFEGDVTLSDLLGDYANTNEDFGGAYGPYTTSISSVNQTSATTGDIVVENIYDYGWSPITFHLDWTNPTNRLVTLDRQYNIAAASTVTSNPAYSSYLVMVGPSPSAGPGTFSICNQTLTLKIRVGLNDANSTPLGWFGTPYTVNMAR
jgi:hypothetical protein